MNSASAVLALAVASIAAAVAPSAQRVYRAPDSDFIATYREVIRDTDGFNALWALSGGSETAAKKTRAPNINFTRKMVIVAAGPAGTAPDSVVIVPDAKAAGVFLVVNYRSCKASPTKTMPIDIIAVPASPGSVLFREKTVKGPACSA